MMYYLNIIKVRIWVIAMNRIYEKLFDGYAQPFLMKDQEVQIFLEPLPVSDDMRLELTDT